MARDGIKPLSQADLHFPSASTNIDSLARQLSHSSSTQSVSARLRSIEQDSAYVRSSSEHLRLPLVANERCGSWYVPPDLKAGSAYFKSTDGHTGVWSFSLRRLNLHLLPIIGRHNGCIIVDSTRRGKYMPDALSKTVPIWCAVLNRLLFPHCTDSHALLVQPRLVSSSEEAQIASRIDSFVEKAKELQLDLEPARNSVRGPMIPRWISRNLEDPLQEAASLTSTSNLVYCCMASDVQPSSAIESATGYVQGAGDDNESWSRDLSPEVFWNHASRLLNAAEGDLPVLIKVLTSSHTHSTKASDASQTLWPYSQIKIGKLSDHNRSPKGASVGAMSIIVCAPSIDSSATGALGKKILHLKCRDGKLGARDLRAELPKIPAFISTMADQEEILIRCSTGKDIAVGVALAIICMYGDGSGRISKVHANDKVDKLVIRRRLAGVMAAMPTASPSRTTLNSLNSFLIKEPT